MIWMPLCQVWLMELKPIKRFEKIGLFDKQNYPLQISNGILQIENELYDVLGQKEGSCWRRPANILMSKGVEYIEFED